MVDMWHIKDPLYAVPVNINKSERLNGISKSHTRISLSRWAVRHLKDIVAYEYISERGYYFHLIN